MFRGYWRVFCAIVWLSALSASGAHAQPVNPDSGRQQAAAEASSQPSANAQPIAPPTIQDTLQRIASALEAANNKPESAEDTEHARRDLAAQEDMARWASLMLVVGGAEIVVTMIGLFLIWQTLIHTRRSADFQKDAVDEAGKQTTEAKKQTALSEKTYVTQNRAWLWLSADINESQTAILAVDGTGNSGMIHFDLEFVAKVVGATPAIDVEFDIMLRPREQHVIDPQQSFEELQAQFGKGLYARSGDFASSEDPLHFTVEVRHQPTRFFAQHGRTFHTMLVVYGVRYRSVVDDPPHHTFVIREFRHVIFSEDEMARLPAMPQNGRDVTFRNVLGGTLMD